MAEDTGIRILEKLFRLFFCFVPRVKLKVINQCLTPCTQDKAHVP